MPAPRSNQIDSLVETVETEVLDQSQETSAISSGKEKDADTRQDVAKKFVRYYFILLTLIIVGIPLYNYFTFRLTGKLELAIPFKDAILTYSAVVGPTVGLVVAYYFKSNAE